MDAGTGAGTGVGGMSGSDRRKSLKLWPLGLAHVWVYWPLMADFGRQTAHRGILPRLRQTLPRPLLTNSKQKIKIAWNTSE
jgi:hypothetical protein